MNKQRVINMYTQIKNLNGTLSTTMIKRNIDNACIPFDLVNTDYQEFLKWLEAGNTPLPADEENN
jgi:hypothetical protein